MAHFQECARRAEDRDFAFQSRRDRDIRAAHHQGYDLAHAGDPRDGLGVLHGQFPRGFTHDWGRAADGFVTSGQHDQQIGAERTKFAHDIAPSAVTQPCEQEHGGDADRGRQSNQERALLLRHQRTECQRESIAHLQHALDCTGILACQRLRTVAPIDSIGHPSASLGRGSGVPGNVRRGAEQLENPA